jgi:hypothetical protein
MVPAPTFDALADHGVAEIREVIGLAAVADLGLLELDEIADVHVVPVFESGACAQNGPTELFGPTSLCSSTQFGWMTEPAPTLMLRNTTLGPTPHVVAQRHLAFEQHVGVDEHVVADGDSPRHVDARRVRERRARQHQLARTHRAVQRLELGELRLVVDAQHFRQVGATNGTTRNFSFTAIAMTSVR